MLWGTLDSSQEGWKWGIRVVRHCNKEGTPPTRIFPQRPLYWVAKWHSMRSYPSISTHVLIPQWSSLLNSCLVIGIGWKGYLPQSSLRSGPRWFTDGESYIQSAGKPSLLKNRSSFVSASNGVVIVARYAGDEWIDLLSHHPPYNQLFLEDSFLICQRLAMVQLGGGGVKICCFCAIYGLCCLVILIPTCLWVEFSHHEKSQYVLLSVCSW